MRIALTVVDPLTASSSDLVVDADAATPMHEVTAELLRRLRGIDDSSVVVSLASRRGDEIPGGLYHEGLLVEPGLTLADSGLVDGSIVSIGSAEPADLREPTGVVEVRYVAGVGAGAVHVLGVGDAVIGCDPSCTLVVEGTPPVAGVLSISREGVVQLRPGDGVDKEALVLDGTPVPAQGATWQPGGELHVGAAILELHLPEAPDAALQPSPDGAWLDYNRPPRLLPAVRQTTFRLSKAPSQMASNGLPILGALAPAALGAGMAFALHQLMYLMMAAMSPLMMWSNSYSARRRGKKNYRQLMKDHREHTAAIEADAAAAVIAERQQRRSASPDPATLLLTATGPRARLWERRRLDDDHLLVRVGTRDLPSDVTVEDPEQLEHRRLIQRVVTDVPVTVSLKDAGVLGVAGRDDLPRRTAAWLVGQLAVLQSPRDVQVYVLTDSHAEADWRWAGWLPHTKPTQGQDAYALIGTDAETIGRRVAELGQMVTARRNALSDRTATLPTPTSSWSSTEPAGCAHCPASCRSCATVPPWASTASASTPTAGCCPRSAPRSSPRAPPGSR